MRLYEHPVSGNSHKVRLLMSFMGLDYESVHIELLTDEQHGDAFLAINPRGEVPVLDDDGLILRDSMAILVHLANREGGESWLPRDPAKMAKVMEWLAFAASWVQYGVFSARALVAFGLPANGLPMDHKADLEGAKIRGNKSLEIMEQHLKDQDWLCGDTPTIADIACFPYVALAPMGDISLKPYPAAEAWIARFKALPGFVNMQGLDDPNYLKN